MTTGRINQVAIVRGAPPAGEPTRRRAHPRDARRRPKVEIESRFDGSRRMLGRPERREPPGAPGSFEPSRDFPRASKRSGGGCARSGDLPRSPARMPLDGAGGIVRASSSGEREAGPMRPAPLSSASRPRRPTREGERLESPCARRSATSVSIRARLARLSATPARLQTRGPLAAAHAPARGPARPGGDRCHSSATAPGRPFAVAPTGEA